MKRLATPDIKLSDPALELYHSFGSLNFRDYTTVWLHKGYVMSQ